MRALASVAEVFAPASDLRFTSSMPTSGACTRGRSLRKSPNATAAEILNGDLKSLRAAAMRSFQTG